MSKKSVPGDGSHNCGTKGGGLYGGHFAVPDEADAVSLTRSVIGLVRMLAGRRA